MPRATAVTVDEAIAVIVQFRSYFETNQLPIWSSEVWQEMSAALNGKWNKDSVYTNVTKNRRNIVELAWKKLNITVDRRQDHNNNNYLSLDETAVSTTESLSNNEDSSEAYEVRKYCQGAEMLDLVLTEEEWAQIKPGGNSSSGDEEQKISLRPRVWTNVVALAMWLQYRMPCAFVFKRVDVSLSADEQTYDITIYGKCKSKRCGNTFDGKAVKDIRIGGLTVEVWTRDTRGTPHDVVKRPLNGEARRKAQKEMKSEGCTVWKKRQARELMRPGDVEPPILPNDPAIRQACKAGIDTELNVKESDARDLIRTLEEMALKPEFCGVIRSIASRPFHVFYFTPAQLHVYREYCRLNRDSCFIVIDATGSVVKTLKRQDGTKSGHIFLYTIVIVFDNTTIAVYQMLSEQHDTELIEFWLKRWLRAGAPKPKEAVCDYSRALLSALCLAFNNQTLKAYVNARFSCIAKPKIGLSQNPATLLSVDVAHLIHLVCRWKCFKSVNHTSIKEFFVRCVALMVDSVSFSDFEDILSLTCAVGLQQHEDASLEIRQAKTTKEARKKLEDLIASQGTRVDFNAENQSKKQANDRPESLNLNDLEELTTSSETDISKWIDQQLSRATLTKSAGKDLNPFYLPHFVENLTKLCREFPLWTRVGRNPSRGPATSSYVESYFNYLKNQVFRNVKRPIRVDKFIKMHARDIAGATLLGSAKLQSNVDRCTNPSGGTEMSEEASKDVQTESIPLETIDPDLMSSEDWRSKAEPLDPINSDLTPMNWNIDSNLMCVANQPSEATYDAEENSVQIVENSTDLDMNMDFLSSTPLADKSYNHELMHLALADHSYSKVEGITGLQNIMDESGCGNLSTAPNGNSPLDQLHRISTHVRESNFKANTDVVEEQQDNNLANNLNAHATDELKPCAKTASGPQTENVPTERCQPMKMSKYFRPYPEVRHMNSHLSNNKKAVLLANGLRCREVKVNGNSYFVHKTCSFDAFAQVLLTAAIDDNEYFAFIQNSNNSMLQLVLQLILKGVTQRTYLERMLILKPFCPLTVKASTKKRVISYSIDAELSIAHLAEKVMKLEPSVNNVEECSHCGRRAYPSLLLAPNHRTVGRLGFSGLQTALDFRSTIYKIRCRDPCPGTYTLFRELNKHVFIELDIRPDLQATSGLKCTLKQIPTTLHLEQSAEVTYEYRLVGIVAHMPGHYVAYCLRKNGCWELYNDLHKEVVTCKFDTEIEPHLAVYIRVVAEIENGCISVRTYIY